MKRVVISQPMLLPWIGIFEQIKASDIFIHYDDVQFPQGRSFSSRVQVKTQQGSRWLTVPVKHDGKQLIRDMKIDATKNWKHDDRIFTSFYFSLSGKDKKKKIQQPTLRWHVSNQYAH